MKFSSVAAIAVTAALVVAGQPHRHGHKHLPRDAVKREPDPDTSDYVPAAVATVVIYILNGSQISEEEVREGISNGTLAWGDDGNLSTAPAASPTPSPAPSPAPAPVPVQQSQPAPPPPPASPSAIQAPAPEQPPAPPPPAAPSTTSQPPSGPSPGPAESPPAPPPASNSNDDDCGKVFPNSTYSCDSFPTGFGATPIQNAGLGGWIGIQDAGFAGSAGYDDISTTPQGSCTDGSCCKSGAFCSYSCPPGYLKSSWPKKQGLKGQSLGGLYCNNGGKLEMADGSIADTLCVKGTDKVTIMVQNKLSQNNSICRTDYPGTESETIPITTSPGQSLQLACPDSAMYYHWDNKPTSAQYYINNKGVSEKDACQWGDGSQPVGNSAPLNLGVGYNSGDAKAYISLFQNAPTTMQKLDFTVELVADDMNGRCKYSNGQYCSGDNYSDCNGKEGCTVALNSGTLTVVLSD